MLWIGWIITALPAFGLLGSGVAKFVNPPGLAETFDKLGWDRSFAICLGIVEIAFTVIYLIPQTSVLGEALLTGYLGGALASHVRIGDSLVGPFVFAVLIWLGLFSASSGSRFCHFEAVPVEWLYSPRSCCLSH